MRPPRYLVAPLVLAAAGALADELFGTAVPAEQKNHTARAILSLGDKDNDKGLTVEAARNTIVENFEKTYITARSGLRLGGDQTAKNILYEAQIFANLNWIRPKDDPSEPPGFKQWLDIPIRIQVRQLMSESKPVRTPSYNPGLRWYGWHKEKGDTSMFYYSAGVFHYSNGQDGPSNNPDGTVNTQNGSFSTNYFEGSLNSTLNGTFVQWVSLEWRQHFIGTWEPFQHEQYERGHVAVKARSDQFNFLAQPSQLGATVAYGYGRKFVIKNDVDPTQNVDAKTRDNLSATLELNVKPADWKDVSIYLRYDIGYDYYNINFQNRMNRIQLGFSSTNF